MGGTDISNAAPSPAVRLPTRTYKAAVSDSTRWTNFVHRPDDIFVCTPPKCGTTWMQQIVASFLWQNDDIPGQVMHVCPWLDANFEPVDDVLGRLEAQTHRRAIKTHTPADGVPIFDAGSYIVVGRDGRDAFMSWVNHIANMQPDLLARLDEEAATDGVPGMPRYDGDIHSYFESWVKQGMLIHHIATWWELRDRGNVLFVHYTDLKRDLGPQMRRVADFLGISVPEERWPELVERCTFEYMRANADRLSDFETRFVGGGSTFINKGTNDRWREVLTPAELERYADRVGELLDPDAAQWLEHGTLGASRRS